MPEFARMSQSKSRKTVNRKPSLKNEPNYTIPVNLREQILYLQSTIGNQAVIRLINAGYFGNLAGGKVAEVTLETSQSHDRDRLEVEQVAEQLESSVTESETTISNPNSEAYSEDDRDVSEDESTKEDSASANSSTNADGMVTKIITLPFERYENYEVKEKDYTKMTDEQLKQEWALLFDENVRLIKNYQSLKETAPKNPDEWTESQKEEGQKMQDTLKSNYEIKQVILKILEQREKARLDKGRNGVKKLKSNDTINFTLIITTAKSYMGIKYGHSPRRLDNNNKDIVLDCSELVYRAYLAAGIELSQNVMGIYKVTNEIQNPRPGDLIVFHKTYDSNRDGKLTEEDKSHIGIWLGENEFIHASSSKGVRIDDLSKNTYWKDKFDSFRAIR